MPDDELVDIVDLKDRVTGSATIEECLDSALLHRAVAVLVERSDGSILLQKRSKKDSWMPGRLTLSCTGHVRKGESYRAAATRELQEELGIASRVDFVGKTLAPKIRWGTKTESEWYSLFRARTDAPTSVDPEEVEGVVAVSRKDLPRLSRSRRLTADARFLLMTFVVSHAKSSLKRAKIRP